MLKTVSDPPHNPHSLEDGILQTTLINSDGFTFKADTQILKGVGP